MQGPFIAPPFIATRRTCERAVEMVFGYLKERRRRPEKLLCFQCSLDSGNGIMRVNASLQFANPIPALRERQARFTLQMLLESVLVKPFIIEGTEHRRQAAQRPDKSKLGGDNVDYQAESRFPCELQPTLRFALHIVEQVSSGQQIGVQIVATVSGKCKVADLVRGIN